MNKEIWKDIPNYEGLYQVSNLGRVKSLNYNHTNKEKILKPRKTKKGYLSVALWKNRKRKDVQIHRLILYTFIGKKNLTINHIDKCRTNNNINNLEYLTQKDNVRYSIAKPIVQYDLNGFVIREWDAIVDAIKELKIRNISEACRGIRKNCWWIYMEI